MPPTTTTDLIAALQSLRLPIEAFPTPRPSDELVKAGLLDLAELLGELWNDGEHDTLESEIIWTALYAFPALTVPGPAPVELVDLAASGRLMDGETADILRTVGKIRRLLRAFEPPGFAAALWRAALLAIYGMIELFVVVDDERGTHQCFELLDVAEAMADKFSGKA